MIIRKYIKKKLLIKRLKKLCVHPIYFAGCEIYRLLGYNTLQDLALCIKPGHVDLATPLLFGRRRISNEEKFIYILNKYIMFIRDYFFIRTSEFIMIIEETLKSPYSKILFSSLEFNKDENYKIFYKEFKKMFISNLFENYKMFASKYTNDQKLLEILDLSLNNDDELEILFKFFKNVVNFKNNDLYCFFIQLNNKNDEYLRAVSNIKWGLLIKEYVNSKNYKYLD